MATEDKELEVCYHQPMDRLRVKVFIYFADQWREKGIGFLGVTKIENDEKCYQIYHDLYNRLDSSGDGQKPPVMYPIYKLTVRSQQDMHERLISTYITKNADYKVQEGSILTWKEGDHEKALSFECAEDCTAFTKIIADIRQVIDTFDIPTTSPTPQAAAGDDVTTNNVSTTDGGSLAPPNATADSNNETDHAEDGNNEHDTDEDDEWDLDKMSTRQLKILTQELMDKKNNVAFGVGENINADADDDDDDGEAVGDFDSSFWKNDQHPILPDVCVDNLDLWVQLVSSSNPNVGGNLLFGDTGTQPLEDSLAANKTNSTLFVLDDANQLYRYMCANNTLREFIDLFNYYESEEHYELAILFKLYLVFRGFIGCDNFDIYRLMFEESITTTLDVIGALEYDPTLEKRVHHRDYLKNKAKFRKFFLLEPSVTNKFPVSPTKNSSSLEESLLLGKSRSQNVLSDTEVVPTATTQGNNILVVDSDVSESLETAATTTTIEQICHKATLIYYLQYIIDHIMPAPSIFDEKLGPLTTYLNHHKADLCNLIYDNTVLLNNLFLFLTGGKNEKTDTSLTEPSADKSKNSYEKSDTNRTSGGGGGAVADKPTHDDYIDSVFFLHEFCLLSNSLNPSDKEFFFHWLESYNLLDVLSGLMADPSVEVRSKVFDIIALLVDNNSSAVRDFNSAQLEKAMDVGTAGLDEENVCLMDHLVSTLIQFHDDPISLHCVNIINLLMDSDIVNNTDISYFEKMQLFSGQFFKYSLNKFLKPFIAIAELAASSEGTHDEDYNSNSVLLDRLVSLLTWWVSHHSDHMISSLVKENVIHHITTLLDVKCNFVLCGVVRLVRQLLELREESIEKDLLSCGTISKVFELFVNTCLNSNNLLNNTILELLSFLLLSDLHPFYVPLVDNHRQLFISIDYIDIFKRMVARHDIYANKWVVDGGVSLSLDSASATPNSSTLNSTTNNNKDNTTTNYNSVRKRKSCEFENSEERWFNSEEEADNVAPAADNNDNSYSHHNENNSDEIDEALNMFLHGDEDVYATLAAKKQKNSPIKVDIVDDLLSHNNTKIKSVDDENLFELLVGNVFSRKKAKSAASFDTDSDADNTLPSTRTIKPFVVEEDEEADDDVIDTLSRNHKKTLPSIPPKRSKPLNIIKIHTNKFNSPKNLVMASSNSKSTSNSVDQQLPAVADDASPTATVSITTTTTQSSKSTSTTFIECSDDTPTNNVSSGAENTFEITNCLVETTFEEDPDTSVVANHEQHSCCSDDKSS